jgi:hypothetical protein
MQVSNATDIQALSSEATGKIRAALDFSPLGQADLKRLSAALSIAASEEIAHNAAFAARLKLLFDELKLSKKPATKNKGKGDWSNFMVDDLVPIATGINYDFNPTALPDPYFLLKLYGPTQLRKTLNRYNATLLREISKRLVLERGLTTKPKSKATKSELIEYIASQVAG